MAGTNTICHYPCLPPLVNFIKHSHGVHIYIYIAINQDTDQAYILL